MIKERVKRRNNRKALRSRLHRKKHLRAALDMAELRKMNDFHEAVIGGISDGLCVCHNIPEYPYTKFTIWNQRMTEITGYTLEEINKTSWYPMIYPGEKSQQRTVEWMERLKKGNDVLHKEWEFIAKTGEKRLVSISISIIRTEQSCTHVLALIKDVTEQKRMEKMLADREAYYRQLTENTVDMLSRTNIHGIFEYVTPSHKNILGYEPEELVGKSVFEFLHPDDIEEVKTQLYDFVINRKVEEKVKECRFMHKSGYYVWLEVVGKLIFDNHCNPMGAIFCSRNVTNRKETEKALLESEEKYRLLVEMLPDAVYIRTKERILFANQAAAQQVGAESPEEIIGSMVGDWLIPHDDYIPEMKERINSFMREGKLPLGETKYVRKKDGETVFFETAARLFPSKNDELTWMLVSKDISERKRAEELKRNVEEKTRLLQDALAYDRLKTEFFANISHELKTPLNVILGCLQMMSYVYGRESAAASRKEAQKYESIMKQNCYRLIRLVNNLIDITKIDSGFMKMNMESHDIVNIVEEITLSVAAYMEAKGLQLVFDTDLEERVVACDPDKIERILLNLLSNAIKFTPAGGLVLVKLMNEEDRVILTIKDTGIGIPEEKQELIFERFMQVDKSFTRNCEGSGIGLNLVKSLVEMHNGKLQLNSTPGEGSEFLIELPAVLVLEEQDRNKGIYDIHGKIERIQIEFSDIYFHHHM
ncbi:MAG: PAS domain S-box protein [Bacillota bacterium]